MKVKNLIDRFDNWDMKLKINDDNLNCIGIGSFQHLKKIFGEEKAISFGVHDNEFCIRIKKSD